jgi:simple sugar transport system ATP-binding protein
LTLSSLTKRFGAVTVLDDVSLGVRRGEIHCLLGENGAGKSTLCNLVFGIHRPDQGHMQLAGAPFAPASPAHALAAGVAMVHQHFSLVGTLNTVENLMLGRSGKWLDPKAMTRRIDDLAQRYELEFDVAKPVEDLSVGERQRIEILKCLVDSPTLLVLDEPTAVLPPREVGALLSICRKVTAKGCAIILVTHKLAEVAEIAHRTTVLRRGKLVETFEMKGADIRSLVSSMVGRDVASLYVSSASVPEPVATDAPPALVVEGLRVTDATGVSRLDIDRLEVKAGEIVGIAGVEGNGQSQLGAVLAGLLSPTHGKFMVHGRDVTTAKPRALTQAGVGVVPEDRHAVGCIVELSIAENLFLGSLDRFCRFGILGRGAMSKAAASLMKKFDVRAPGPDVPMSSLSGGNQQKVVLARELTLDPLHFLLAAQPTRGLDVGAVEAVFVEIRKARDRGAGVLLISSELDELVAVSDRILVMYRGRIVGQRPADRSSLGDIGAMMSGQERAA